MSPTENCSNCRRFWLEKNDTDNFLCLKIKNFLNRAVLRSNLRGGRGEVRIRAAAESCIIFLLENFSIIIFYKQTSAVYFGTVVS